MVGLIVISFFGVVVKMSLTGELNWGEILPGFVPDLSMLSQPAHTNSTWPKQVNFPLSGKVESLVLKEM